MSQITRQATRASDYDLVGFGIRRFVAPDGEVTLVLLGELDLAGSEQARAILDDSRREGTRVRVVLDDLTFLDVSGLRVLLHAARAAHGTPGMAMTRGSAAVRRLVQLAEVGHLLPWEEPGSPVLP